MSDTLATINVDQLSSAVSRAVGLSRLADQSLTASKIDCQHGAALSTAASPSQTKKSHVFVKPSVSNSSKRKRQAPSSSELTAAQSTSTTTVHVSTIKPNPVSVTRSSKYDNTSTIERQREGETALTSTSESPSSKSVVILPRSTDCGSTQTIQVPVLQTLASTTKIINAYIPSPNDPLVLSPISLDGNAFQMLPQTSTSVAGIPAITQTISSNSGPVPSSMSAPQDLLAAATQAAVPHLITQYPKQPDLSSCGVAPMNGLVKVVPMSLHGHSVTTPHSNTGNPINIVSTSSLPTSQQHLTIYQIVTSPTTTTTNTAPTVANASKTPSTEHSSPPGICTSVAKLTENDGSQIQKKLKTVYTLLLGNSDTPDNISSPLTRAKNNSTKLQLRKSDSRDETLQKDDGPEELFMDQFCADCDALNGGRQLGCAHHPVAAVVPDNPILSRARMSLPPLLEIREDAKNGVFTRDFIPARTRFGPLIGIEVSQNETSKVHSESCYLWKIYKTENEFVSIDCTDESTANWMRFVRTAHTSAEQNIISFQEKCGIYFITNRDIPSGCELLHWFSRGYANILGKNHRPEDWFTCGACKKQFQDFHSVTQHIRYSHPDTTKRKWKCEVCQRAFASAAKLNTHKMSHAGVKPHTCHVCDKSFTDQSNLRIHMIIHSGERKFKCTICSKAFRQKAHLKSHMLTHTGEKRMQCQYCSKLFGRRSDVRVHEMQHTKERVYKCLFPDCGKEFYKTQSLNKHLLIHSGVREHQCSQCLKSFLTRYHLKRHLKSCHSEEKSNGALSAKQSKATDAKNTPETSDKEVE